MNILSIFSNIGEGDTMYVVIAIIVILLLWGFTKMMNKKKQQMGLLSDIFDFLSSFTDDSYIEEAKVWGDRVWNSSSNKKSGTLSLNLVDDRLYKRMRIVFYDGNIANITNEDDRGWSFSEKRLTRIQRKQLSEEGMVEIKRYKH